MARILIPLLVSLTFASLARGVTTDPQAKDSKYRLPLEALPNHYKLTLVVNMTDYTFIGNVQINITAISNSTTITLNAKNLTIGHVHMTNSTGEVHGVKAIDLDDKYEILTINLQENIVQDEKYLLTIPYTGVLNDQRRGFYKSRSIDEEGKPTYVAATHFEPTGARLAFPCWDEPAIKAHFEINIINSPSQYSALSNMNKIDETNTANLKNTTFKVTPRMSTYLVAFVVSDYKCKTDKSDSMEFRVWTKPLSVNQTEYALEQGRKLLEEMERYTDIKFSDFVPKMDQVSLKDFSAGAMENWGLVTYRESALLVEKTGSVARRMRVATVIAHEFAHQWFGNLVSPKWWKYIWLNEGFADYFEYFLTNVTEPNWRLDDMFVVNNIQAIAFTSDAVEDQRPMNHDVNTPQEISNLFDNIAYQKSGSVIRMMSHILGEKAFQNGLRNYLSNNKLNATDSDILLKELGNGTKYNNVPFEDIMSEWVNKPGYPVVNVTKVNNKFELIQQRFTYGTNDNTSGTKWWVPVTFVTSKNLSSNDTQPRQWLNPNENKLVIPVSGDEKWIIVNVKQAGYYRVNYDPATWNELINLLNSDKYIDVHPTNRAQLIDDALNMARINWLDYKIALNLMTFLKQETDFVVWQTSFRHLQFLHNLLRTSEHYSTFQKHVENILAKVTSDVKYKPKGNDTDLEKLLRINAIDWACRANVSSCVDYATNEFNEWLKNINRTIDDDLKVNVLCAGIKTANNSAWNETLSLVLKIKDEEERLDLYPVLACNQWEKNLERYLGLSLEENATLSFSSAVSHVISRHPHGADIALRVLAANYKRIKSKENGNQVIMSAVNSIAGAVTTVKQLNQISEILSKIKDVQVESVTSAFRKALVNLNWIDLHQETVENWLTQGFSSASSFTFASLLLALSMLVTRLY